MIWQLLFWISVGALIHSYVVYPALLKIFGSNFSLPQRTPHQEAPTVCVIMAAYNEEKVIEQKIRSVFQTDYPTGKLSMWIGSDGSTDRTNAIIHALQQEGYPIQFRQFGGRNGKSAILNSMAPQIDTDILIPTDANIFFRPDTIPQLVRHFSDPQVALVGANIVNTGMRADGISHQEETYIRRENYMKYYEGVLWGTTMGAFGACYAIRKHLFPEIPKYYLMEDFYITMYVITKGQKAICDLEAIAQEDVSNAVEEEFKRKVRISAGNYQNLRVYYPLLGKPLTGAGFSFWSHKFLRWMGPFLLLISTITAGILWNQNLFFRIAFLLQIAGILSPLADRLLMKMNIHNFALRLVAYFYLMNLALLLGFWKYIRGVRSGTWNPTQRNITS